MGEMTVKLGTAVQWFIVCCLWLCCAVRVYAVPLEREQPAIVSVQFQADEAIRAGQPFTVSVTFRSEDTVGAAEACVRYDRRLSVVSVTCRDKQKEDVFQYFEEPSTAAEGVLRFVVSASENPRKERMVDIRFRPQETGASASYSFYVAEAAACDANGRMMTVDTLPTLTLTESTAGSVVSVVSGTSGAAESDVSVSREYSPSSRQSSERTSSPSSSPKSQKESTNDSRTVSESEETLAAEQTNGDTESTAASSVQTIIIREKESDSVITQGVFLSLLGIVLIIGVLMLAAFRLGKRQANKQEKEK